SSVLKPLKLTGNAPPGTRTISGVVPRGDREILTALFRRYDAFCNRLPGFVAATVCVSNPAFSRRNRNTPNGRRTPLTGVRPSRSHFSPVAAYGCTYTSAPSGDVANDTAEEN